MNKMTRSALVVGVAFILTISVGCGKDEPAAASLPSSEGGGAESIAQVSEIKVFNIEIALPMTEASFNVSDVADGKKAYTRRYIYSGEFSNVKPAINSALAAAGYRISEVAEEGGVVKFIGRADTKRISIVVYPHDEVINASRISVFWEE